MNNNYLVRSVLFFPAHNKRVLDSALRSDADALVFDLEDSVLPIENKQIARDFITKELKNPKQKGKLYFVRTNEINSGLILKDLDQVTIEGIDGFFFPKINCYEDIVFLSRLLDSIEMEKGYPKGKFKMVAIIESAAGLVNVREICKATERMIGLIFGCHDYIADVDGIHDKEDYSIMMARSTIVTTAKANKLFALDAPHINVHDMEDLERHIRIGRNLGFDGMPVLHPKEIPYVNKYYSPSLEEVKEAEMIMSLNEQAITEGKGVTIVDGHFIGPPIIERLKKVLQKQRLIETNEKLKRSEE